MVRFRPLWPLAAVTALIAVPLLPLAASAQTPKYGGVLVTAPLSAAPSLSPHEESTVAVVQQASPCFNNLVYYDPEKKQFVSPPRLPDWATVVPASKPTRENSLVAVSGHLKSGLPTNGNELHRRLREADSLLAAKGLCQIGDLLAHVTQAGVKAGHGADLTQWGKPAIELAAAETRAFKSRLPSAPETGTAA